MNFRKLGNTGLSVSEIGFGTWQMGGISWAAPDDEACLSLLERAYDAGINYYGLVRPQIEFRADVQQLQRNTTMLQSGVNQLSGNDLATGHPVGYMYFGGYYPSLGRGGVPARTLPGAPARPQSSAVTAPAPYRR